MIDDFPLIGFYCHFERSEKSLWFKGIANARFLPAVEMTEIVVQQITVNG
jgi:hypothetical protein